MSRSKQTLNPLNVLQNAIQNRNHVRVVLRRHHEGHNEQYIEGWPQSLDNDLRRGVRVVMSASQAGDPGAARWIVHIDRIALVELLPDSTRPPGV